MKQESGDLSFEFEVFKGFKGFKGEVDRCDSARTSQSSMKKAGLSFPPDSATSFQMA
jgi:hypothetical protein